MKTKTEILQEILALEQGILERMETAKVESPVDVARQRIVVKRVELELAEVSR